MSETSYSVVIRVKNSARTIKACISSLLEQDIPPKEIIIVDSGSSDQTIQIIEEFEICKVVLYPDEPFNYSKALNIGIREVSQPYVLNFSSHCYFIDPKSIQIMLGFIVNNKSAVAVTFGHCRRQEWKKPLDPSNVSYRLINRSNFRGHAMDNPCAMIRTHQWKLRHFNEDLERCEDQEWAYYWIKNENYYSVMIDEPKLIYDQPNFDARKVAKDFFTVGHLLHSYPSSVFFMIKLFIAGFFRPKKIINYHKVIYFLIMYRIINNKGI